MNIIVVCLIISNVCFALALFLCVMTLKQIIMPKLAVQKEIYDILADKLDNKDKIIKAQDVEIEKLKNALRGDANG